MSNDGIQSPLVRIGIVLLGGLLLLGSSLRVWADSTSIGILYPEIREPYRAVFRGIIDGIEGGLKGQAREFPLAEGRDLAGLERQLEQEGIKVIIALGRGGLKAAEKLGGKWPLVVGAVLISGGGDATNLSGISLTPDPEVLFEWLNILAPEAEGVTVIYNPSHRDLAIDYAREAAKHHGIRLKALPAENIREAAVLYRDFLNSNAGNREALWLPQDDSVLDEVALLPVILKEAWDKNLVVFSSTPDHVKKGALFSLYPDNTGMGRRLAVMALEQLQGNKQRVSNIRPLQDLLIAVNLRTAEHLGLEAAREQQRKFDLVFPSP